MNNYELRKKAKREETITAVVAVALAVVLAALLLQFAWNVGLVGMLAAAGLGNISGISLWTALGGLALTVFVRGLFVSIRTGSE